MKPTRIQLSRRKGWRMPPNTVKVDRSTKWGNPFIVGQHGGRAYCVELHRALLVEGLRPGFCVAADNVDEQQQYLQMVIKHIGDLRGKNLACWCPLTVPCHADTLLAIANSRSKLCINATQ